MGTGAHKSSQPRVDPYLNRLLGLDIMVNKCLFSTTNLMDVDPCLCLLFQETLVLKIEDRSTSVTIYNGLISGEWAGCMMP